MCTVRNGHVNTAIYTNKSEMGGFYTSELFKYLLLSTESLFGVEALDVSDDVKVITKSVIFFLQLLHLTLSKGQFVFDYPQCGP